VQTDSDCSQPIAFLDSGIGGMPYLLWLRKQLPKERLIYFADHLNFPYGVRSSEEIILIVLNQAEKMLRKENPKLFVLACNSATVHALRAMRDKMDIPVVGVVPAIKPAANDSITKVVGIWATEATVHSSYMQNLIDQFAQGCRIVRQAETELVNLIEEHILDYNEEQWQQYLESQILQVMNEKVDRLVLGCTHFTYLSDLVEKISKGNIQAVDSREGVTRQIVRVLSKMDKLSTKKQGQDCFYTSKERDNGFYKQFAEKYQMAFGGEI